MLFASRNVSPVEGDNAFFDYEQKLVREMFQKDDMVRYGAHGVCKVEDITEKNFNGDIMCYGLSIMIPAQFMFPYTTMR